jgi:hypothetical protein
MHITMKTFGVGLCAACLSMAASITLSPLNGQIQGTPGQVIGWGFQFNNDTPYFALLTSSQFTPPAGVGSYTDLLAASSNVVDAHPHSLSDFQSFSVGLGTGLGAFNIDPNAASGDSSAGTITVSYDLYSMDPSDANFDPLTSGVSFGNTVTAPASVLVDAPEPSSIFLWSAGLALLAARWRAHSCVPCRDSSVCPKGADYQWGKGPLE